MKIWFLVASSALVIVSTNVAQAVLLDNFQTGDFIESSGTFSRTDAGSMLGGFREVVYTETTAGNLDLMAPFDGDDGLPVHTFVAVNDGTPNTFSYKEFDASGVVPFGITDSNGHVTLTYDASGAGLGSEDLAKYGGTEFQLDLGVVTTTMTGTLTVEDGDSSDSVDFGDSTPFPLTPLFSIGYSAFTGIDFTDIESISIDFDSVTDGAGGSGELISLEAIGTNQMPPLPEPSTMVMTLISLLCFLGYGARRRPCT